jgi:hypothetical protein
MSVKRVYLVIGADRSVRAAVRPRLGCDEVAISINLRFPDTWGRVIQVLDVDVPDFTPDAEVGSDA